MVEFIWKRLDSLEDNDILDMLAFTGEDVNPKILDAAMNTSEESETWRDEVHRLGVVPVNVSKGVWFMSVGDYYVLHADGYREVLTEYQFNKTYNELTSGLMKEDI